MGQLRVALLALLALQLVMAEGGATKYLNAALWSELFLHTSDSVCSPGFYTYKAFRKAVADFPAFASASTPSRNRRELAAFLAQISAETTGGWPTAPDGPFAWGLCFREEGGNGPRPMAVYCQNSTVYPCVPGKRYYGRGPIQLSWNYNYGRAGVELGLDLLKDPDLVSRDAVVAFKTALHFWMTSSGPKPSCHEVMTGQYRPAAKEIAAGRLAGFGLTTNIINGVLECGKGSIGAAEKNRLGFFRRYAKILKVRPGRNLTCKSQQSYPPYSDN